MKTKQKKDIYAIGRFLYILEAGFEYFISLLITGAYLAKVADSIGINDSLTGILSAFVSMGNAFQIFALFLVNKKPVKKWVTVCHTVNELSFGMLYVVPLFHLSSDGKTVLFVLFLLVGYIVSNVVLSPKMDWFMALVDDTQKGRFTATKEIVSLIGGVVTSLIAGRVIDTYEAKGELRTAFAVTAAAIFLLTVAHTLTLVFAVEKKEETVENHSVKETVKEILSNRKVIDSVTVCSITQVALYCTTPFYGSYQIKELGFSMTFVSVLAFVHAAVRALCSRPFGKYADKTSFVSLLYIGYAVAVVAFTVNIFTAPQNGKILYTIHYILYAVTLAATSGGQLNLIFTSVPPRLRMGAYALNMGISGFSAFLASVLCGLLVEKVQSNGNIVFGQTIYAQQILSAVGALFFIVAIVWLRVRFKEKICKKKK